MKRFKALSLIEKLFVLFVSVVCPLNYLLRLGQPDYSPVAFILEVGDRLSIQDDAWVNSMLLGFVIWTLLTLAMFTYGLLYTFGKFRHKRIAVIVVASGLSLVGYYYRFFKPGFILGYDIGLSEPSGLMIGLGIKCLVLMLIFNTFFTVIFLRKSKKAKSN